MQKIHEKDQQMHFYVQHSTEPYSRQQFLTLVFYTNHYFNI